MGSKHQDCATQDIVVDTKARIVSTPAYMTGQSISEVADGPPVQFTWRRVRRRVAFADGPERIAPEWWRGAPAPTRDYFRIEDEEHRRYWLYRDGLYGIETGSPRWYMHGLFP